MEAPVSFFTNRNPEKEALCKFLQGNLYTKAIMDINGMSGMGKTQLLLWAYNQVKKTQITVAYYDFNNKADIQYVDVLKSISEQSNKDSIVPNMANSFTENEKNIDDLCNAFNKELSEEISSKRVVFFFDTTENATPETLEILDTKIFPEHVNHGNLLITCSGEKPLNWRTADIRKRRTTLSLNLFSKEESKEMIETLTTEYKINKIDNEIIELIQYLSDGNPGIIYESLNFLSQNFSLQYIDADIKKCNNLVKKLHSKIVDEKILPKLKNINIENVDNNKLISQIAMLRKVDLQSFRKLVALNFPESFSKQNAFYYDTLLKSIHKQSSMFQSKDFSSGYVINRCVRKISQLSKWLDQPKPFKCFQDEVSNYYKFLISKTNGIDQKSAIIEYLYTKYSKFPALIKKTERNCNEFANELNELIKSNLLQADSYERDAHLIDIRNAIEADDELNELLT